MARRSFSLPSSHLPRTGGVSVQNGTVLGIGVGQRTNNTVQVTDHGNGDFQAEWNGGPVRPFTGHQVDRDRSPEGQEQSDHLQLDRSQDQSGLLSQSARKFRPRPFPRAREDTP